MSNTHDVTALLKRAGQGDGDAMHALVPLVYDELQQLARRQRFVWRHEQAPGTRSLVHEAYVKLVAQSEIDWQSRAQFFCVAAKAMRSVLVDNARHFGRLKREGGRQRVDLEESLLVSAARSDELVALDAALSRLAAADPRLAAVVECRFFGGLTIEETAEALQRSPATVKRDWVAARTWLYRELAPDNR
jgi:RNA polymerase sigma factor (TIGR02999 family)